MQAPPRNVIQSPQSNHENYFSFDNKVDVAVNGSTQNYAANNKTIPAPTSRGKRQQALANAGLLNVIMTPETAITKVATPIPENANKYGIVPKSQLLINT